MSVWYGVLLVVSVLLNVVCGILYKKKNPILLGLFTSLTITNFGYFFLSLSSSINSAMLFNSIAYLGSVLLPLFMLLIIASLSDLKISKKLIIGLAFLSLIVFIIASSGWYSNVYYKTVEIATVNNATVLVKTYGPLHPIYKVYIISYLLAMISTIIYSFTRKNKDIKISIFMTAMVSINIGVWLTESVLHSKFEYMAVSYVVTEILLLLFYGIINDLKIQQSNAAQPTQPETVCEYLTEAEAEVVVRDFEAIKQLTNREKEVFVLLLEGKKRKEIAEELFVTESTIKKHSASIYKKLEVENRKELFEKVKSEKINN